MDNSVIRLDDCNLQSSQGPAIDMTGMSMLSMTQGRLHDCVGKLPQPSALVELLCSRPALLRTEYSGPVLVHWQT